MSEEAPVDAAAPAAANLGQEAKVAKVTKVTKVTKRAKAKRMTGVPKKRSGKSTRSIILEVLAGDKSKKGVSAAVLRKEVAADSPNGELRRHVFKRALFGLLEEEKVVRVKGIGLSGSFKLAKPVPKAKAVKKSPLKRKKLGTKPSAATPKKVKTAAAKKKASPKKKAAKKAASPTKKAAKKAASPAKKAAKKPAAKKRVVKVTPRKPAAKKPAAKKPAARKPAAKKSTAKK